MANISEWIPRIAPSVALCPNQVIKEAIINTCRDFCQKTQLWGNNALTAIDVVDGTSDYDLTSALGDICGIDAVELDDTPIAPTTVEELDRLNNLWRQTVTSRSSWYVFGMADSIKLVYEPDDDITGGLEVWVSLKPLKTATTVEDFLYRDFEKAIENGAKGELFLIPGMPWSNTELGAYFVNKYEAARDTAKMRKFTGRTNKEMSALHNAQFFA